ncbi:MAG: ATP-binding protein [Gammaproteobacteria bacterium]|nr:ATP-binding protein [Gammaproteobacteria bacterium]
MSAEKLFELRFPSKPERLCLVRALVKRSAEQVGCCDELTDKLVIALNEACMNVIQHAYQFDESGEIVLEIHAGENEIQFRLTDGAKLIELEKVEPRDLEDVRPGGLGVHFIREIMDDTDMGHLQNGEGNYLAMKKTIY